MNRLSSRRRPAGFTLIELLTVIAIIGILAAIVITTVGKVRQNAQQTRSLANLRQFGSALQLYASDRKNAVPVWHDYTESTTDADGSVYAGRYWWEALQPYLGNDPEIFRSPAHAQFDKTNRDTLRATISYGWNYAVMGRHRGDNSKQGDHTLRITDFPTPARTLAASDGRATDSWGFIASDSIPDVNRYSGRVPSLFVDGHVTTLPGSDFQQVDPWFNTLKALPANK